MPTKAAPFGGDAAVSMRHSSLLYLHADILCGLYSSVEEAWHAGIDNIVRLRISLTPDCPDLTQADAFDCPRRTLTRSDDAGAEYKRPPTAAPFGRDAAVSMRHSPLLYLHAAILCGLCSSVDEAWHPGMDNIVRLRTSLTPAWPALTAADAFDWPRRTLTRSDDTGAEYKRPPTAAPFGREPAVIMWHSSLLYLRAAILCGLYSSVEEAWHPGIDKIVRLRTSLTPAWPYLTAAESFYWPRRILTRSDDTGAEYKRLPTATPFGRHAAVSMWHSSFLYLQAAILIGLYSSVEEAWHPGIDNIVRLRTSLTPA